MDDDDDRMLAARLEGETPGLPPAAVERMRVTIAHELVRARLRHLARRWGLAATVVAAIAIGVVAIAVVAPQRADAPADQPPGTVGTVAATSVAPNTTGTTTPDTTTSDATTPTVTTSPGALPLPTSIPPQSTTPPEPQEPTAVRISRPNDDFRLEVTRTLATGLADVVAKVSPRGTVVYSVTVGDHLELQELAGDGTVRATGIRLGGVLTAWGFGPRGALYTMLSSNTDQGGSFTTTVTEYSPRSDGSWAQATNVSGEMTGECGFLVLPDSVGCTPGTGPRLTVDPPAGFDRVTADTLLEAAVRAGNGIDHEWDLSIDPDVHYNCDDNGCASEFLPGPDRGAIWVPYMDEGPARRAVFGLDHRPDASGVWLDDVADGGVAGVIGKELIAVRDSGDGTYELVAFDLTPLLDLHSPIGDNATPGCTWSASDIQSEGTSGQTYTWITLAAEELACRSQVITQVTATTSNGGLVAAENWAGTGPSKTLADVLHEQPATVLLALAVRNDPVVCGRTEQVPFDAITVWFDDGTDLTIDLDRPNESCGFVASQLLKLDHPIE
jgi:hypothetical protein